MTNREAVSLTRTMHKLLSGDNTINDRTILSDLKVNALPLIRQYTNKRQLWATDTIYTTIPCLELESVPASECCGYISDITLSRSKVKLPTIAEGAFEYIIQGVYSVESSESLKYVTLNRFINILKLGLKSNDVYFFVHNSYIYTSSPYLEKIKVVAYIEGDLPDEILYSDCECTGDSKKKEECRNPLDETFKCPGFLVAAAAKITSINLVSTYFKIPVDHTSDEKDDQVNKT